MVGIDLMRDFQQYLEEVAKCNSIIEALRYTSLLRVDNAITDATYISLVRSMFVNDAYEDWLADPRSVRELAELICQRR